jgi:hypothetical protein
LDVLYAAIVAHRGPSRLRAAQWTTNEEAAMNNRGPLQITRRTLALALAATGGLGVGAGERPGRWRRRGRAR